MDIQQPINFTNVLDVNTFLSICDMFYYEGWSMRNGTEMPTQNSPYNGQSWLIPRSILTSNLVCYDAATTVKYKIKKHIHADLELIRMHSNGQTRMQPAFFHSDFTYAGTRTGPAPLDRLTFILFTETSWNAEWGGEFICQNPNTKEYYFTPYIPNNGVVIPSHWEHRGSSPNGHTDRLRTTLAFSYKIHEVK